MQKWDMAQVPKYHRSLSAAVLMASPVVLSTAYLVGRKLIPGIPYDADYFALALVILIGCLGVVLLPVRRWARVLILVFYLPSILVIVVGWSLAFVCGAYGGCL